MLKLSKAAFTALCVCVLGIPLLGQYQGGRVIEGEVKLPNDRPAGIGLYVALESDASGGIITSQTDSRGKFSFNALVAVRYRVRVRAVGYEEATQEVDLSTTPFALLRFVLKAIPGHEPTVPGDGFVVALPNEMPDAARKEYAQGFDDFQNMQFDKSIPHFQRAADLYPKYAPTYYYLGAAFASVGKLDDAAHNFRRSIEFNAKSAQAYLALGTCEFQQQNFSGAEQSLQKAVDLSPDSFEAHYELARAMFALQQTLDAHQHLRSALKLNPNSAEAHILMGNIMLRLHNRHAAVKEYQEALHLAPKGPMAEPARQMIAKLEAEPEH